MQAIPANINANASVSTDHKINNQIMIVGVSAIGAFVLWRVVKKYMDNAGVRAQNKALNQQNTPDPKGLTMSQAEATIVSEKLYAAMDGIGTDTKTIMDLLIHTPRTNDDLKLIVRTFGLKEYGTTGSPYWGKGTPSDLSTWLRNEMSGSDLQKLQVRFAQAGITF